MFLFLTFIIFILGLIFGSFANVLIYRIPKKISILFPNSFCPHCFSPINWYDNIPVLSYILLSGKCRTCGKKISLVYPIVELLCGVLAVFVYLKFGIETMWIFFNLFFILLVISAIDIQTTEIPDVLSFYLIISGIIFSVFNPLLGKKVLIGDTSFIRIANSLIGGISGFLIFFLIDLFGSKIFKRSVLGGGDIKLLSGIGTYLGIHSLFKIIFFSSLVGTVYIFVFSITKKKKLFGEYIQFSPFISIGCLIYVFLL